MEALPRRREAPTVWQAALLAGYRSLHRLQQNMPLSPERELDHALGREVTNRQRHLLVGHGLVVDPQSARLDLTARLAVRGDELRLLRERGKHADASLE